MYQGTFAESFKTQYGHMIKVNTEKGEWKLFGKGPPIALTAGTPVQFEAVQKGNNWNYTNLQMPTAATQAPPAVAAPAAPRAQPTPQGAATPVNLDKERDMFVTGVVGRAMGGGQFSASDIKILTLAADEAWTELVAKRSGRGPAPAAQPQAHPGNGGPPAGDPRFQAPPF